MSRLPLALCIFLLLVPTAEAQTDAPFTFSGQLRHRSELDGRDFNGKTSPADIHLLRTRLNVAVRPEDRVRALVQIQDSRRFGGGNPGLARGTMDPSAGQLDVHQAYFVLDSLFDVPLSLKIGRQELVYGNQRLIGSVGWSNVGRTFDAGVLNYSGQSMSVDFFAARLVGTARENGPSQNLFGVYSSWQLTENHALEAYTLLDNNTNQVPDRRGNLANKLVRLTPGVTLTGTVARMSYTVEAALQAGEMAAGPGATRSTIESSMLSATAKYALGGDRTTLGAGYTRLSGDDRPGDDVQGEFNTLFATNHKFYGYMDYFPGAASPYGLQDVNLEATVQISQRVDLATSLHHFAQSEPTVSEDNKALGQELDVTVTYSFADAVTFKTGLSGFLPGKALEARLGNDDPAVWGHMTSVINF